MKKSILFLCVSFFACSSVNRSVFVNPQYPKNRKFTVAVLPLENNNPERFKKFFPEAGEIVRDALEASLIKTGWQIIERDKIAKVINELELQNTGLTLESGAKIGKMLNADVIILGQLTSYVQGAVADKSPTKMLEHTTVGFNVRAVHVENGIILWNINVVDSDQNIFTYTKPVQGHAIRVAEDAVDELLKKMPQ